MGISSGFAYEASATSIDSGGVVGSDIVLLSGDVGSGAECAIPFPRTLLPLINGTVLETLVTRLSAITWSTCTVCSNGHTDALRRSAALATRIRPKPYFLADAAPLGPAGCLRACDSEFRGESVFVAGGSTWLEEDPAWMIRQHLAHGNALTVYCTGDTKRALMFGRTALQPSGVYCVQREALSFVKSQGFQDIKEQLIPALRNAGLRVGAVRLRSPVFAVTDWPSYMRALSRACGIGPTPATGFHQLRPGVWCGEGSVVSDTARLSGPIVLGEDCVVEAGVSLNGPVVLGSGSRVGADSSLIRVVAPNSVAFPRGSFVSDRFIGSGQNEAGLVLRQNGRGTRPSTVLRTGLRKKLRFSRAGR